MTRTLKAEHILSILTTKFKHFYNIKKHKHLEKDAFFILWFKGFKITIICMRRIILKHPLLNFLLYWALYFINLAII